MAGVDSTMNYLNKSVKPVLLWLLLITGFTCGQFAPGDSVAESLERFEAAGIIERVNSTEIVIRNKQYRFNSGFRFMDGSEKQSVRTLNTGDLVWLRGRLLNQVSYVDLTSVLPHEDD